MNNTELAQMKGKLEAGMNRRQGQNSPELEAGMNSQGMNSHQRETGMAEAGHKLPSKGDKKMEGQVSCLEGKVSIIKRGYDLHELAA